MSDAYEDAYQREKQARLAAERLLENSSRELYLKNQELEEANRNLKLNQQTLVQSEKMASVGLLASGIAHEINNPLGYALSNLSVLSEYVVDLEALFTRIDDAETMAYIRALIADDNIQDILADLPDLIKESLEGLETVKTIVGDLRAFARSGDEAAWADVNEGIRTTLNVFKGQLKNRINVETNLGDLPQLQCQLAKLNQVFGNIVFNAAQAQPEGGTIYIDTATTSDAVVIEISDDGPGIPEESLQEIFSPFYTTKPVGEGTGLGLAICYAIVTEDHGGSLSVVEGGRGSGATFRIELPLITD